jgi:hypothetical protein
MNVTHFSDVLTSLHVESPATLNQIRPTVYTLEWNYVFFSVSFTNCVYDIHVRYFMIFVRALGIAISESTEFLSYRPFMYFS